MIAFNRGCFGLPKLQLRVQFPLPAPQVTTHYSHINKALEAGFMPSFGTQVTTPCKAKSGTSGEDRECDPQNNPQTYLARPLTEGSRQ